MSIRPPQVVSGLTIRKLAAARVGRGAAVFVSACGALLLHDCDVRSDNGGAAAIVVAPSGTLDLRSGAIRGGDGGAHTAATTCLPNL